VASLSVAFVTPSFNQRRYLEAAIASVLAQNHPRLSYAVVDGASTDGSAEVVKSFATRLAWCVSEKDYGQYEAINKGFRHVEGDVMGWLNSDDLHCPWALAVVTEIFENFPEVEWLTTRYPLRWDAEGRATNCSDSRGYAREALARGEYCGGADEFFAAPIQQESTFWRRSLWERTGATLSTEFGAAGDFELWCRFAKHAQLHAVNVPLGGFRQHGDQQTSNARDEYFRQARRALETHYPGRRQSSWYRRLRPLMRDRLPASLHAVALSAGLLFEAPVISRTRDNSAWRIDHVRV
jgi:glycosyltransferase involved in cell wall biosynthesis